MTAQRLLGVHASNFGEPIEQLRLDDLFAGTADAVRQANTARHAYEVWEAAGVLRPAGDRLCAAVKDVLQRFTEGALSAEVAMVVR